jgi:hypothetical protein
LAWRSSSKLLLALLLTGCGSSSHAWLVKPHQRALLADRLMRSDAGGQGKRADQHVLNYREGALGGDGSSGGGCGCN